MCTSRNSAQAGNIKLAQMAKLKQLEMYPDKTGFILLGGKSNIGKIKKEIESNPIYFNDFETKEKSQELVQATLIMFREFNTCL